MITRIMWSLETKGQSWRSVKGCAALVSALETRPLQRQQLQRRKTRWSRMNPPQRICSARTQTKVWVIWICEQKEMVYEKKWIGIRKGENGDGSVNRKVFGLLLCGFEKKGGLKKKKVGGIFWFGWLVAQRACRAQFGLRCKKKRKRQKEE